MKEFWAWIEKRGLEAKDKVIISLTPKQNTWEAYCYRPRRELTTIELGEVHGLFSALDSLITTNPGIFHADGSLKVRKMRTTLVIEHDADESPVVASSKKVGVIPELPTSMRVLSRESSAHAR